MGVIIIAVFWLLGLLMAWSMCVVAARADRHMEELHHAGGVSNGKSSTMPVECPMARVLRIPLSDIERTSCGLCGTVRSHGRPIPGHVLTREESIWLQPFASWS